jgi:hypothetical protein
MDSTTYGTEFSWWVGAPKLARVSRVIAQNRFGLALSRAQRRTRRTPSGLLPVGTLASTSGVGAVTEGTNKTPLSF